MLVSIALGVLATRLLRGRLTRLFTARNEYLSVLGAAALGLISPLPTYAAVPLGISLMPAGVPFSAVLAFAIASPLMNPSIFYLTAARLGMEMALVRTGAAYLLGVAGGMFGMMAFRAWSKEVVPPRESSTHGMRDLWTDVRKMTVYTARVFGIATLISAAVKALVPAQTIVNLAGEHAAAGTLIAMGLGVPFYTCGGAAIPLVETLMDMGMGKGPVLAFFIAGPATKLETIYAIKSAMGTKVLLFYLGLTLAFACAAGSLYSMFG
jgi:uncharacterized membrane protein YraQ (UPF0718 family)